jgi:hypothetical protein
MARYLVIALETATSSELIDALLLRLRSDSSACFDLVVPATPVQHLLTSDVGSARDIATRRAHLAREVLTRAGLRVLTATTGDPSPNGCIEAALANHPGEFQGIIVSNDSADLRRWSMPEVIRCAKRLSGLPVQHVTVLREHSCHALPEPWRRSAPHRLARAGADNEQRAEV